MEKDKDDESEECFEMVVCCNKRVHTSDDFGRKGTKKYLIDKRNA